MKTKLTLALVLSLVLVLFVVGSASAIKLVSYDDTAGENDRPESESGAGSLICNGNFDDWIAVRSDPDNVAYDTQVPEDPDWPGQPDRDIFYVNSTFDDEYLYFCWRRTAGGNKAITMSAYLDLGGDGLLNEGEDVVVAWTTADPVSTAPSQQNYDEQGRILHYYQARDDFDNLVYPAGDPMDHYGPPPVSMQNPL